jgi:hypothetical protein
VLYHHCRRIRKENSQMEQAALLLDAAAEDPSRGSGKPGCRKTSSGPVLDCRVSNYVRENRFYLKPRLETCRFDLGAIAQEFQLPPRTHDNISPREVCGIPMSHAAPDPRLEAVCDWKTQTVRQFALTLPQAALKVKVREIRRRAVPWPGDEHRVEIVAQDHAIQMCMDEINSWTCTPVPSSRSFTCSARNGSRRRVFSRR